MSFDEQVSIDFETVIVGAGISGIGAGIETHIEIARLWSLGIRGAGILLERCLEVF